MKRGVLWLTLMGASLVAAPVASGGPNRCAAERAAERAAAATVRADQNALAVDMRLVAALERRSSQLGDAISHAQTRLAVNLRQEALREAFLATHCQHGGANPACAKARADLELAIENAAANRATIAADQAAQLVIAQQLQDAHDVVAAAAAQFAADQEVLAAAKAALAACRG